MTPRRAEPEQPDPEAMRRTLAEYRDLVQRIRTLSPGSPEQDAAAERARELEREIRAWRNR